MSELKEALTIGSGAALVEAAMRVEELEAENERLRDALEFIAGVNININSPLAESNFNFAMCALEGTNDE